MAAEDVTTRAADLPDAVLRYAEHADGLLDVHLPPGPTVARPLLVYVHGGFWRQATDRRHARPLAEDLAGRGWVVAVPEYRRVGGAGGWPTTATDVEAAATAAPRLLDSVGVPTTSLTVVGHSAGGHLALWLATRPLAADVRRVVALAPVGDLGEAARRDTGAGAVPQLLGGSPDQVPEAYAAADPATRLTARPACGPDVVVVHGDADDDVPVDNSRSLAARQPWLELRELAGVGHLEVIEPTSAAWPAVLDALGPVPGRGPEGGP